MDPDTLNNLIAAASGLLGALVGGGATIWATTRQQRSERASEIEREERAAQRERQRERDERAKVAAIACLDAALGMADEVAASSLEERPQKGLAGRLSSPRSVVTAEAFYLPDTLRGRFDEAMTILYFAYDVHEEPFAKAGGWAAETVRRGLRSSVAAWLQDEPMPPRSDVWTDFVVVAEAAEAFFSEQYQEAIGDLDDQTQAEWRARNARARKVVGERA